MRRGWPARSAVVSPTAMSGCSRARPPRPPCGGSARTAPATPRDCRMDSPAWPGFEDAAVPPDRLAPYLTELHQLLRDQGMGGVTYGHFGEGCIHLRVGFGLDKPGGRAALRRLHGGRCGPRGAPRRDAVGRARRWSGSRRPAAPDVLAGDDGRVPRLQDDVGPGRACSTRASSWTRCRSPTRCAGRSRRAWTSGPNSPTTPTTATCARRSAAASGSVAASAARDRRSCAPATGRPGREQDSTRGRARMLQEMMAGSLSDRGLALDRGPRRPRPVPVLQGLRVGVPHGRRHGQLQVGVPAPPLPGSAATAVPLLAGRAAALAAHVAGGWRRCPTR